MDTIKALDELLPGFQEFLFELQKFELSSNLQETLSTYLQRLDSYTVDHTTEVGHDPDKPKLPYLPPPPLPGSNPSKVTSPTAVEKENVTNDMLSVEELAAQRNLSWQYANIPAKKIEKPKVIQTDDIYETPINEDDILNEKSLSLPDSDQEEYEVPLVSEKFGSPVRDIDDDGEVYEEPGDYENTNHQGRIVEDGDLYENPEDEEEDADGGFSDASGSYESFDSDEYIEDPEICPPSLPERSAPVQSRNSKAEQFKTRCENDPYIIHSGILSFKSFAGTLSRLSIGKWSIKYCIVYKGLLSLYNKPSDKAPSKNLTLFGYDITEQGPDGKYEHVFGIQHQGQATQNFATTTRDKLETWIKVLKEESTNADNIPTCNKDPHSPPVEQSDSSLKGKIKIPNLVKRKSKPIPIQLSEDTEGNLAGLVNILSPVNGEPKWKERFCFVTSKLLHVYKDSGAEKLVFSQPLKGMEIGQGKPNIKRKNTLTLYQGDTVYIYIEAVNHVDHGQLLSKLIKETGFGESLESPYITPPEQIDMPQPKTSTSKQPSIFSLMQRFEMPTESDDTSKAGTRDSIYLEMEDPSETKPDTPTLTVEDTSNNDTEPVYENSAIRSTWIMSKLQKHSPNTKRKDGKEKDKEKEKDNDKKEKKEKKKKKNKDKDKKSVEPKEDTGGNTESADVSSQLNTQTSTDASATEDVAETKIKEKPPTQEAPKIENKFVTSDKKHLLDVDRLQSERKILLQKREDLRIRKIELRGRKNACENETKKAKLDQQYKEAVQEWTASSKELTELDERIQKISKGEERGKLDVLKSNAASGRASPMLQRVQSSKSIADRMKMFEAMSGKD